jgi:membrane protein implicated in regulation of membrane protease activity
MSVLLRYVLLQIPGILLVSVAVIVLWRNDLIGTSTAAAALALWVLKDMALYPLYRSALRPPPPTGIDALVGQVATAHTEIAESGLVGVRGELWQARAESGRRICSGARVEITAARGMRVTVKLAKR